MAHTWQSLASGGKIEWCTSTVLAVCDAVQKIAAFSATEYTQAGSLVFLNTIWQISDSRSRGECLSVLPSRITRTRVYSLSHCSQCLGQHLCAHSVLSPKNTVVHKVQLLITLN